MKEINAHKTIDAKGLACPMPIVQTKREMEQLQFGQVLEVVATDPGSTADLKAWAESASHQYLGTLKDGDVLKHYLRKTTKAETAEKTYKHVLSNQQLAEEMHENESLLVIDVREEAEYSFSHIPNTINIPFGELKNNINKFAKDKPIYLVCRTGNRSDLAAKQLTELGYTEVYNVVPGMSGWTGETNSIKR